MKNKLSDLNMYLFEQIEKLNDDDLTGEELSEAIQKAEKIVDISREIIHNQETQLKAINTALEYGYNVNNNSLYLMLGVDNEKKIQ